jgi:AmiR/NasT family two-component response regulator
MRHGAVPTTVVFSRDETIIALIVEGLSDSWRTERYAEASEARSHLKKAGVEIVIIDDDAIEETIRGWVLDQTQRWAARALVAYIAANHSPEVERWVRSHRVQYYLSKPVDREEVIRVLRSFAQAVR